MALPNAPQVLPRAPNPGLPQDAFTGVINANFAGQQGNAQALDARLAVVEASGLPAGSYTVPSNNAQFTYSAKANPWSSATLQTRLSIGMPYSNASCIWAFPLSVGNTASGSVNTYVVIWGEGNSTNGATAYALKAVVISVDQSGNQTPGTVNSFLTSSSTNTSQTSNIYVLGFVPISATAFKLYYGTNLGGITPSSFNCASFNYDGSSTLTSTNTVITSNYGGSPVPANPSGIGYICGTSSVLIAAINMYNGGNSTISGVELYDRSTQTNNQVIGVADNQSKSFTTYAVDSIGNGQLLEVYGSKSTQDTNTRLTVSFSQFNDFERFTTAPLRLVGANSIMNSLNRLSAWSASLFDVQWTDSGNTLHTSLFTNNNGTLGFVGTYSQNNAIVFPRFWQMNTALIKIGISSGAALNQYLFSPQTYNPNATQPGVNDLTGSSNFSYYFGNVTSAVQSTINAVVRLAPDILAIVGFGGTSSTKNVIAETVVMS